MRDGGLMGNLTVREFRVNIMCGNETKDLHLRRSDFHINNMRSRAVIDLIRLVRCEGFVHKPLTFALNRQQQDED